MLPQVAEAIMRAARDRGVRAIRNPFVPLRIVIFSHVMRRPKLWKRYFETTLLRRYHHAFRERVKQHGMVTPDGSFGVISTGVMDDDIFAAIAGSIPDGTWELVCHPGYNDAELGLVHTRLRESRARELAVFLSRRSRQTLADHNIELISYHEFANQREWNSSNPSEGPASSPNFTPLLMLAASRAHRRLRARDPSASMIVQLSACSRIEYQSDAKRLHENRDYLLSNLWR
jgi:hypothetical protein